MENNTETQDEMIKFKVRTFISLIISVIVVTNSFSLIYQKVLRNEEQAQYDRERADRKNNRAIKESKDYHDRVVLEKELEDCINSKQK